MIQKNIGELFKSLRIQRALSQSDFYKIGLSKSDITEFETGSKMLEFGKVISALKILNITLEEFAHFIGNFELSRCEKMLNKIEKMMHIQNFDEIRNIENEAKFTGNKIIEVVAKSTYKNLKKQEIDFITAYLYQTKNSGYFEVFVLFLTVEYIGIKDVIYFLEAYLEKWSNALHLEKYHQRIYQTIYKTSVICIYKNNKVGAEYFFHRLDHWNNEQSMYILNIRNFVFGYYISRFENTMEGDMLMKHSLAIIEELCSPELYQYFSSEYSKLTRDIIDI